MPRPDFSEYVVHFTKDAAPFGAARVPRETVALLKPSLSGTTGMCELGTAVMSDPGASAVVRAFESPVMVAHGFREDGVRFLLPLPLSMWAQDETRDQWVEVQGPINQPVQPLIPLCLPGTRQAVRTMITVPPVARTPMAIANQNRIRLFSALPASPSNLSSPCR